MTVVDPLNDCYRATGGRMPVAQAVALLRERIRPVTEAEAVPLADADGRILARPVIAHRTVPPFDNSAVDGYAYAHAAAAAAAGRLRLAPGRTAAGHPFDGVVGDGEALRALTGARMPAGTDTVAMQEDVRLDGGWVEVPVKLKPGANRRRAGEDVTDGAAILPAGIRLRPQDLAAAASVGNGSLSVRAPLRVALFSIGDELREPGAQAAAGQIYDSNRPMLSALLRRAGFAVTDLGILPDDAAVVRRALAREAEGHHALVTSAGASIGDEDHTVAAVRALGTLHAWQIAIKPGRPIALGQIGDCTFVGLPGNPVAVLVCFARIVRPMLLRLAGLDWQDPQAFPVPADFAIDKKPGRREYWRARLARDEQGGLVVQKFPRDGSGLISSLTWADGLIEVGEDTTRIDRGQPVDFLPFAELGV